MPNNQNLQLPIIPTQSRRAVPTVLRLMGLTNAQGYREYKRSCQEAIFSVLVALTKHLLSNNLFPTVPERRGFYVLMPLVCINPSEMREKERDQINMKIVKRIRKESM